MLIILPIGLYVGAMIGLAIAEAFGGLLSSMFSSDAAARRPRRPLNGLRIAQYVVAGLLAAPAVAATVAHALGH